MVLIVLLVIASLFLNCADKKYKFLTISKTICYECDYESIPDSSIKFANLSRIDLNSRSSGCGSWTAPYYRSASDTISYDYYRFCYNSIQCDSCIANEPIKIKREEEEKKHIEDMQRIWKKQIQTDGQVEVTSLTPIDYNVIYSLKNTMNKNVTVEYEVECWNRDAPGIFFDSQKYKSSLKANESNRYVWKPLHGIEYLRNTIIEKTYNGENLTSDEIRSLQSDHFDVKIKILDIVELK